MKLVLSTFACNGVEAFLGRDIAAGVQVALRHYVRGKVSPDRRAAALPALLDGLSTGRSGVDLELAIDPEIQAVLEREARESGGVPVEQIATHAVLVCLADLDRESGREPRSLTCARPLTCA